MEMENPMLIFLGLSVLMVVVECYPAPDGPKPLNRTRRDLPCDTDAEYPSHDDCCLLCPAGSYAAAPCTADHQRGDCEPCTPGEGYTVAPNGLDQCESCRVCRQDQVTVQACTPRSNTICRCRPGTYCIPGDTCEICRACARCDEGKRIKEECTPTKDTVCEDIPVTQPTSNTTRSYLPPTSSTKGIISNPDKGATKDPDHGRKKGFSDTYLVPFIVLAVILGFVILGVCGWRWYRQMKEKEDRTTSPGLLPSSSADASANSSVRSTPLNERANQEAADPRREEAPLLRSCRILDQTPPNQHSGTQDPQSNEALNPGGDDYGGGGGAAQVDQLCHQCEAQRPCDCDWTEYIYAITDHVEFKHIIRLVRHLRVPNVTMDSIAKDYGGDCREHCYQLLMQWRSQAGAKASLHTVFQVLREMELVGCVERIAAALQNKGVPIS